MESAVSVKLSLHFWGLRFHSRTGPAGPELTVVRPRGCFLAPPTVRRRLVLDEDRLSHEPGQLTSKAEHLLRCVFFK